MDAMRASNVGSLHRGARRRGWLAAAGLVVGLAGGGAAFALGDPVYESSTAVLVEPVAVPPRSSDDDVNLQTEAQLARSTDTAADAAGLLGRAVPPATLVDAVAVEVVEHTSVLVISFEAATPDEARAGASAFAEAYLDNRAESAHDALTDQTKAVGSKVTEVSAQLRRVNERISDPTTTASDLATLRSTRASLAGQIASLTTRLNGLQTTTIKPGRVIRVAERPTSPVRPKGWLYLGYGAAAGAVLGALAAATGERLSRRVRRGTDVSRRAALPILAELSVLAEPSGEPATGQILAPHHPGGRAFNRLRNEVVAALGIDSGVILVTGASPGPASTLVAANLAASLARADNEVILIGANMPELGVDGMLLSHVFDIADIPGLTDVLTRRAGLPAALQRAPRTPGLRVVTSGATASAAGLLQSEGVRTALRSLRGQARYVVIEAPSAASGADAQSLARVADAAILVAEAGRSRHTEVADAAMQLRLVGTRLLGAVVVPRLAPRAAAHPADDRPRVLAAPDRPIVSPAWDDNWLDRALGHTVDSPTAVLRQVPTPRL